MARTTWGPLSTDETLRATGSKYAVLCVDLFRHIEESLKALEATKQEMQNTPIPKSLA